MSSTGEPFDEERYDEVIEEFSLAGSGLGFVDIPLLATLVFTPGLRMWTTDDRLLREVERSGTAFTPPVLP
jgi:hypothetical protein